MKKKPDPKQSLRKWGAQTTAIHAGEPNRHGVGGPVVTDITRTSTFTFSSTAEMKLWAEGKSKAYIYTRYGNPTLAVKELSGTARVQDWALSRRSSRSHPVPSSSPAK